MNAELVINLQKNLMRIAGELESIRLNAPRDFEVLNLNVGRIQGLAQGLDWYISQISTKEGTSKTFGFPLSNACDGTISGEEEED